MSNQKRAGALLTYVQLAINMAVGIIYTPIMLRYLGQSEYGVYSIATAVISFLTMLDLGFGQTLVRFHVKYRAEGQEEKAQRCSGMFLELYLGLGVLALAVGLVLADKGLPLLFSQKFTLAELALLRRVLKILVINLAVSFPLSVFSALITAYERFTFAKVANIANTIFTYGGILIVLRQGYQSVGMATVTTVVSIGVKLVLAWYCLKKLRVKIIFSHFDKAMFRNIFSFSFFIFLNIVIDQLYNSTDKFILGAVCGSASVTVYTVGVQFNAYFQQLSTAISGVYLPHITKLYTTGGGGKALSDLFVRIGRLQYVMLSFVLAGFIAFGRQFILLLGGTDNAMAYWIALIIMIPGIVPLSQNIGVTILQAMNRHRFRSVAYLLLAVLNVVISIPLAMRWEGVGAAVGTSLACFAGQYALMNWFYYKKIGLDIPAYWRMAGGVTLKTLPMAIPAVLIHLLTPGGGWLWFFIRVALFTAVYVPYGWLVIFDPYEKGLARSVIKRLRRQA